MKTHPIAELFPLLPEAELQALADDIKARGLLLPIVTYQGKILDGRNREAACERAGVKPSYEAWQPKKHGSIEAFLHVQSLNMRRRNLSQEQRAAIMHFAIEQVPELKRKVERIKEDAAERKADGQKSGGRGRKKTSGTRGPEVSEDGRAREEVAELYGVSGRTVERVTQLAASNHDLLKDVAAGTTSVTKALRQVKAESIAKQVDWPEGQYRVIYADPPWSYGNTQPDYHTEQRDHYPVMPLKAICELPVKSLALPDAVLFLWVTSPVLEESFQVVKAWGFKYKASFVWDKVQHNMGHYNSVRHEFVLVCTRGACMPDVQKLFDSVITEERSEHSRKPDSMYTIIETLYPHGPRIELFARSKRKGWNRYGHQS